MSPSRDNLRLGTYCNSYLPQNVSRLQNVPRRLSKSNHRPREHYDNAIALLQSKRDEITALYRDSAELDERYRQKSLDYIDEFFEILDDPDRIEREIFDRCRGEKLMQRTLEASKDQTSGHSGPP